VVIALGYGPTWTDPLLVRVADDLARLGIAVLVPELPGLSLGNLVPEDVEVLVGAFEYLSARKEVDEGHVGYAGFCVGSSIALVAAEDPRIAGRVAYVSVFGGYYDLRDLMRAVATHWMSYGGEEYAWNPTVQAVTMYAQNVLLYADSAGEREALRRNLRAGPSAGEPPVELTPTGRLLHRLLTRSEPAITDETIRALPAEIHSRLDGLSPSTHIDRLQAQVFIMHDVSDPYVPVTESQRLADALAGPREPVYAQFSLFEHVYPSQSPDHLSLVGEGFRLFSFMAKLMRTMTVE
jgi:dienelactone hydrolase